MRLVLGPWVEALLRRQVLRDSVVVPGTSLPAAPSVAMPRRRVRQPVGSRLLRIAASTPEQCLLSSFFAPALRASLPEHGGCVIEAWPKFSGEVGTPTEELLRFAGGPVPLGKPIRFPPCGKKEVVVGFARCILRRQKGHLGRGSKRNALDYSAVLVAGSGASSRAIGASAVRRESVVSLLKRRRANALSTVVVQSVRRRLGRSSARRHRTHAKLKRFLFVQHCFGFRAI